MADWSLVGDGQQAVTYGVTSDGTAAGLGPTTNTLVSVGCRGTMLLAGGPSNAKTAWQTIIPINTLAFDAAGFIFSLVYVTTGTIFLFDIGFGATPAVVVSNLVFYTPRANQTARSVYIPLAIPKNTQVSFRRQTSSSLGIQTDCIITPIGVGFDPSPPFGVCNTYGVTSSGGTSGTDLNPFGSPNVSNQPSVKGPYSILGTTTAPVSAMLLDFNEHNISSAISNRWAVDIAIGAPASEQVIIANIPVEVNAQSDQYGQAFIGPIPCHIPSGVAISARCATACNTALTSQLHTSLSVYCFS